MPAPDEITLTLPRDRDFQRVAHLVLGGLAVRLELTIETLEDLQLALSAILDRVGDDGEVTVRMTLRDGTLETSIGPVDLAEELARDEGEELGLSRILRTVIDDVQVDGDHVRLTKKVQRNG
jgi:anti-sigma regulatory factor (Ser/Thr protein kinase)